MKLRQIISLYENNEKIRKITSNIVNNYNKEEVISKIEKKALDDYVPSNWEAQAESEMEWYNKYGENQAENDVITEIINKAARNKKFNLNSTEIADLQNWFYNAYNI